MNIDPISEKGMGSTILLCSQVVQQEALTRLLVKKGIVTKEEFLEIAKVVNQDMKKKGVTR